MTAVRAWRGIRYATARHRFAAPELTPFPRVPAPGGQFAAAPWQPVLPGLDLGAPQGDDSLALQVWAPQHAESLPVVLWLYGGGFEIGAASTAWTDAAEIARRVPCVVVAPNYRVGAYGFAHLARHGGDLADAANLGLRDAIAAYEWTRAHIAGFGGDPERVTVAGQSAGGFLACALAVSPGLDRPAGLVCLSGAASRIVSEDTASGIADALLAELGLADDPERIIECDPANVIAAQARVLPADIGLRNGPLVRAFGVTADAALPHPVVPTHPLDAIRDGALDNVFLVASATVDEASGFDPGAVGTVADAEALRREAVAFGGDRIADAYTGPDLDAARRRLLSDYVYRLPAARTVAAQIEAGGRAALWDLGRAGASPAGHGADLPALFGPATTEPRDAAVWAEFAHVVRGDGVARPVGAPFSPGLRPADVAAPADLVTLWEGVARP